MKTSKKIFSLALALVMALGMAFSFTLKTSATGPSSDKGTITITNAAKGETYTAYQVFGATYDAATKSTAWTIAADSKWKAAAAAETSPFTLTEGTDDTFFYVNLKDDATDTDVLNWVKNNKPADAVVAATTVANGDKVVFNDVPYGYYLITSTVKDGAVVTIDKVNPAATVIDKNENEPSVDEEFKKILVNGKEEDATTAKVGDIVTYQVKVNTVNWVNKTGAKPEQVYNYTIVDTPTNIAIDEDTVAVKVGTASITNFTTTVVNGVLTVTIPWISDDGEKTSLYNNGSVITLTYDAEVLPSAVGTGVSTNHAAANWNDTQPIGEDETEVFNYKFDIKKYDASDESKETLLEGAKFKLYDNNQALINLVAENGYYRVATPEEAAKEGFASAVPVTDANGYFQIKGLSNGTYWLEETEAPKGFNKLTSKVSFEINGSDKIGSAAIEVANNKGKELPSTGGMGTTIFYTVGGILVVGAAVLLITKKRMDGAQ